ncbi:MAG: AAA family ATPase [Gammaproteobacteria bacterium]|nr:AAA family ATPase [Gammaproteobacteria bacterium]
MSDQTSPVAHVIVFGNEKGGTGKSTTAMHVVVTLLKAGAKVATVDLDARQRSLHRYIENREAYQSKHDEPLLIPESHVVPASQLNTSAERDADEKQRLGDLLKALAARNDFIVIDCPGNDTNMARLAHSIADTLVTPMNDSFVDLDLIGQVNDSDYSVKKLSHYSETVWESRKQRTLYGKKALDWVVMRNRISTLSTRNMQRVHQAIEELQKKIAFRYVPGLSERVVYRELFPKGLTLMDISELKAEEKNNMSHVAARFEIKQLVQSLKLPGIDLG